MCISHILFCVKNFREEISSYGKCTLFTVYSRIRPLVEEATMQRATRKFVGSTEKVCARKEAYKTSDIYTSSVKRMGQNYSKLL